MTDGREVDYLDCDQTGQPGRCQIHRVNHVDVVHQAPGRYGRQFAYHIHKRRRAEVDYEVLMSAFD